MKLSTGCSSLVLGTFIVIGIASGGTANIVMGVIMGVGAGAITYLSISAMEQAFEEDRARDRREDEYYRQHDAENNEEPDDSEEFRRRWGLKCSSAAKARSHVDSLHAEEDNMQARGEELNQMRAQGLRNRNCYFSTNSEKPEEEEGLLSGVSSGPSPR